MEYTQWPIPRIISLLEADTRFDLFDRTEKSLLERGAYGLVPFVVSADRTRLIWGFSVARYARVREAADRTGATGTVTVPVAFTPAGTEGELRYALLTEGRAGAYGWREKAKIFSFRADFPGNRLPGEILALVAPEGDPTGVIERYVALPEHLQRAVNAEAIDIRTAEICRNLGAAVFSSLNDLGAPLSFSRRKSLLVRFAELSARETDTAHTEPFRRQTELLARLLRDAEPEALLTRLRYPVRSRMEEVIKTFTRNYLHGHGIRFSPPAAFEGDSYDVSFSFRSRREYDRRVQALANAQEGVDELLEILF